MCLRGRVNNSGKWEIAEPPLAPQTPPPPHTHTHTETTPNTLHSAAYSLLFFMGERSRLGVASAAFRADRSCCETASVVLYGTSALGQTRAPCAVTGLRGEQGAADIFYLTI